MLLLRRHLDAPAVLLLLLPAAPWAGERAAAQILDLNGGSSTLYQSEGGSLTLRGLNFESGVSAGTVGGHVLAGGHLAYRNGPNRYLLGLEQLNLNLPTDVLSAGHRLIGLGADFKTTQGNTAAEVFAGTTSVRYESPFVQAAKTDQAVAALLLQRSLSPHLSLATQALFSPGDSTFLQAIGWQPRPSLALAFTTGMSAGSRYNAASVVVKRPLLDLKAAYIDAGAGFHRAGSQADLTPEPLRENVLFSLRSSSATPRFTLSGGRQNLMSLPLTTGLVSATDAVPTVAAPTVATIDELSASLRVDLAGLTASAIHSVYRGQTTLGFVESLTLPVTQRIVAGASYFDSRMLDPATPQTATRFAVGHFQEALTSRWAANQTVTLANGQTTVGFGGSFLSNLATVSTDYETFYIASRPQAPFQQSIVVDVRLNLFGRLTLHGASFVSPQGKLLYTADAHGVAARAGTAMPTVAHASFGEAMLLGRVVDTAGQPIEGAAIRIEGQTLYTDSSGVFLYREKRPGTHELTVLLDQFLDGRSYWVVSKPDSVKSNSIAGEPVVVTVALTTDKKTHFGDYAPPAQQAPGTPGESSPPSVPSPPPSPPHMERTR